MSKFVSVTMCVDCTTYADYPISQYSNSHCGPIFMFPKFLHKLGKVILKALPWSMLG